MPHLTLFFTGAPLWAARQPRLDVLLIHLLSGSRISHCLTVYDSLALEVGIDRGVRYFHADTILRYHPHLRHAVRVTLRYRLDLSYFDQYVGCRIPFWPTFLRWIRSGRCPLAYDCLGCAILCLKAGGLEHVPDSITTPAKLFYWLTAQGFPHVSRSAPQWRELTEAWCAADRLDGTALPAP